MSTEFKAPDEEESALEKLQDEVTDLGLNINIMNQLSADDIDALENEEEGLATKIIGARKAAEKAAAEGNSTGDVETTDDEDLFAHEGKQRIVPRTIN